MLKVALCSCIGSPIAGDAVGTHKPDFHASMLTKKGKYGLKALVHLAQLEPGKTAFISEIAEKNNISKKFLDAILLELRKGGILRSKKGPGGGYALSKPASQISIGQVVRILDGPLAPIRCASKTAFEACDDCDNPEDCQVRHSMTEVRDAISSVLDNMTLEEMVAKRSVPSVEKQIQ
jgi:Rrf2 family protein